MFQQFAESLVHIRDGEGVLFFPLRMNIEFDTIPKALFEKLNGLAHCDGERYFIYKCRDKTMKLPYPPIKGWTVIDNDHNVHNTGIFGWSGNVMFNIGDEQFKKFLDPEFRKSYFNGKDMKSYMILTPPPATNPYPDFMHAMSVIAGTGPVIFRGEPWQHR